MPKAAFATAHESQSIKCVDMAKPLTKSPASKKTTTTTKKVGKAADSLKARDKLLRAAEVQFLRKGFGAASIRTIAEKAGVNSALITYHFGGKEGLFRLVFANAIAPINQQRMENFTMLEKEKDYTVEQILHAWVNPIFQRPFIAGARPTAVLSFSLGEEQSELHSQLISETYDEVNEKFLSMLEQLLPHVSRATLVRRLFFLIGAMMMATRDLGKSLRNLSRGQIDLPDLESLVTHLVVFSAAGFRAADITPKL